MENGLGLLWVDGLLVWVLEDFLSWSVHESFLVIQFSQLLTSRIQVPMYMAETSPVPVRGSVIS